MTARLLARLPADFTRRLLLIAAFGLVLRLVYVLVIERGDPLSGDGAGYHHQANMIADGKGFTEPFRYIFGTSEVVPINGEDVTVVTPAGHLEPTAGHPPVWILMLGAVSFLGFTSVLSHQLASALFGVASIILLGLLGRSAWSERAGLIAAGLAASYAFIWVNDGLIMAETAAIAAAAGCSLMGLRFARDPSMRNAILLGVLGAVATLSRAELALFLPIVAAVALIRAPLPWRRRIALYAVTGISAVIVVAPWVARNLTVFEEPVLLSNGVGTVMVQSNCDAVYYGDHIGYWNLECGNPQPYGPNGELLDEAQRDVVVRERALDYIENHRRRLVTVVIPARIARMWALYQPVNQLRLDELVEQREFWISMIGLIQFYVLAPLAIVGGIVVWRRHDRLVPLLPLAIWPAIATFTAAISFGNTRYRTAAEVSIVILAALAIDHLWSRVQASSQPPGGSS